MASECCGLTKVSLAEWLRSGGPALPVHWVIVKARWVLRALYPQASHS